MALKIRPTRLGSRPGTPAESAAEVPPGPAIDPGARALPLIDSRATERLLEPSIAMREILGFPLLYLADLPAGWCLSLEQLGGEALTITSRRSDYERIVNVGGDVLNARWLWPITLAAEHGRGNHATLTDWLKRVRVDRTWQLTPSYAFDGVVGRFESQLWHTERVLKAYGLRLLDVS